MMTDETDGVIRGYSDTPLEVATRAAAPEAFQAWQETLWYSAVELGWPEDAALAHAIRSHKNHHSEVNWPRALARMQAGLLALSLYDSAALSPITKTILA